MLTINESPFARVIAAARVLAGYPHHWWFAGGWAIDLFLGRVTREHGDIEIGVFRQDQGALREHLSAAGRSLSRLADGKWQAWGADDQIRLPDFLIIAASRVIEPNQINFFLDDQSDGRWVCRRHPPITVPVDELTLVRETPGDVLPFLRPEIQLLYKAKHRAKDENDFDVALPVMNSQQRRWLRDALQLVHADDPWLARL